MVTFDRLQQNIMDVIAEEQIKLGYRSEVIHLLSAQILKPPACRGLRDRGDASGAG